MHWSSTKVVEKRDFIPSDQIPLIYTYDKPLIEWACKSIIVYYVSHHKWLWSFAETIGLCPLDNDRAVTRLFVKLNYVPIKNASKELLEITKHRFLYTSNSFIKYDFKLNFVTRIWGFHSFQIYRQRCVTTWKENLAYLNDNLKIRNWI